MVGKRVFVYGSCATRDAFELVAHDHSLIGYVCRSSFGSAFAPRPFALSLEQLDPEGRITSPFQARMVRTDLAKGLASQLRARGPGDTVVVDLIDERFPLIEWQGTLATHSASLTAARALAHWPELRLIPPKAEAHVDHWQQGLAEFARITHETGFRVVLNAVLWAERDTQGQDFPAALVEASNTHLRRLQAAFQAGVPCQTISPPLDLLADPQHKWGRAAFHYALPVYRNFMAQLDRLSCP
jgi:hypothetical protein